MRGVIYLKILTVFWIGWKITSVSYWMCIRLMMMGGLKYTWAPITQAKCVWIKNAVEIYRGYKSLGIDQIPTDLIQTEGRTRHFECISY